MTVLKMRVIDFRVRPPVAGFEKATMYVMPDRTAQMGVGFGFPTASPTLREPTAAAFEVELNASGCFQIRFIQMIGCVFLSTTSASIVACR